MSANSQVQFANLVKAGTLCRASGDALNKLGYTHMSPIQAMTFEPLMLGRDMMARAKTGTGKTLAFLLPTIEHLSRNNQLNPNCISALVMSPTRELAQQIEAEAQAILQCQPKNGRMISVQCVVGGTNVKSDLSRMKAVTPTILVATPGRLLDLLENYGNVNALVGQLSHLILDECDRLLDAGFSREIQKILNFLPERRQIPRQCLLFSATISSEVKQMSSMVLLKDHTFVSTVSDEDDGTHAHVQQSFMLSSFQDTFPSLLKVIQAEQSARQVNKIIVFFPTARATQLAAELFNEMRIQVSEIHSRKSQSARTKVSDAFRAATNAILFSSDVSARGLDFPGITLVVQIGLPSNREQYVHRLGRTARAGETGRGLLMLSQMETFFLKALSDIDLIKAEPYDAQSLSTACVQVNSAMSRVDSRTKSQCYAAMLGFYKSFCKQMGVSPAQLVRECNTYAVDVLLFPSSGPMPEILKRTAGKMGLSGVPGLNLVNVLSEDQDDNQHSGSPQGQHRSNPSRGHGRPPRGNGNAGRGGAFTGGAQAQGKSTSGIPGRGGASRGGRGRGNRGRGNGQQAQG